MAALEQETEVVAAVCTHNQEHNKGSITHVQGVAEHNIRKGSHIHCPAYDRICSCCHKLGHLLSRRESTVRLRRRVIFHITSGLGILYTDLTMYKFNFYTLIQISAHHYVIINVNLYYSNSAPWHSRREGEYHNRNTIMQLFRNSSPSSFNRSSQRSWLFIHIWYYRFIIIIVRLSGLCGLYFKRK